MPFDGRWFYGDAVFITDPWIWLALGGTVFLRHSTTRKAKITWLAVAGLATAAIFLAAPSWMLPAKVLWLIGLGLFVGLRFRGYLASEAKARRFAIGALAFTTVYIGIMIGISQYARSFVAQEVVRQGVSPKIIMVGPVPLTPFVHDVLVETPEVYRYGTLEILPRPRLELEPRAIPKPAPTRIVTQALQSSQISGFMNWVRFPYVEIDENESDYTVYILDARYTRERTGGFGAATVVLPKDELGADR
jgi:inner membrane protein